MYYVTDITGFALLSWEAVELKVYYYDFEQKFSSMIKIRIPDNIDGEIKLSSRSIWIATRMENAYSNKCLLDVISIKNEREWYHIRINSRLPTYFLKYSVFSGIMLVGNDITDNVDDDQCFIFFSSCKALYIHHDKLIPYEINEKQFTEFYKPEELHIKDLTILGIFRSTIVLLHDLVNEDSTFLYVVSYNERLQLPFFKKIDLTVSLNDNLLSHPLSNLAELGKIFLITSGNSILVTDFRTLQVSQILECSLSYLLTYGKFQVVKI